MSSFSYVDEGLEETHFVDAVNGYDSSVNDDSVINGEILEEEEEEEKPFEKEAEPEPEPEAEAEPEPENITFTVTDGSMNYFREYYTSDASMGSISQYKDASMNYFREYYTSDASMGSIPQYKDASMNNTNRNASFIQQPIPRRPNSSVFNRPVLRPGHHLKTMFF